MFSSVRLKQENAALRAEIEALNKLPVLVGIHRKGSVNDFTFIIEGKEIVISTYSTNFDQVQQWKKDLKLI